ncbi:MAG: hypothetical protein WC346_15105 [Methanogenium sp.]|jgi:hypothetical protein
MKDKCIGLLGRMFGHNFKPRYSTKTSEPSWKPSNHASMLLPNDINGMKVSKSVEHIYEGEICVRCGEKIDKKEYNHGMA